MFIEPVMPSNHLILCHPLLLLPSIFPSIRVFSNESAVCIRWPNYWCFITLWQIDREIVRDFIFLGSKITADGDCSHQIKRCLLLGRKAMTNLDSILKSRHYFAKKGSSSQSYGFSSSHYRCKSWTIRKAECGRIDAFELWCWRRLLESLGQQGDPTSQS